MNPVTKVLGKIICSHSAHRRILKSDQSGRSFKKVAPQGLRLQRLSGVRRVSVLSDLRVGETGVLVALELPEAVQNHLMHMGFVPDARVTALRRAPAGDPSVYAVDGIEIALRRDTASAIRMRAAQAPTALETDTDKDPAVVGAKTVKSVTSAPGELAGVAVK